MYRWNKDLNLLKKRKKIADHADFNDLIEHPLGRFRKKKVFDCGRAQCTICHSSKVYGLQTPKDKINKDRMKDSFDDFYSSF